MRQKWLLNFLTQGYILLFLSMVWPRCRAIFRYKWILHTLYNHLDRRLFLNTSALDARSFNLAGIILDERYPAAVVAVYSPVTNLTHINFTVFYFIWVWCQSRFWFYSRFGGCAAVKCTWCLMFDKSVKQICASHKAQNIILLTNTDTLLITQISRHYKALIFYLYVLCVQ